MAPERTSPVIGWTEAGRRLAAGEVGVLPTDTLYGLVGSALVPAAVERIYNLRQRDENKPMIVLIGEMGDTARLHLAVRNGTRELFNKIWPGPVSVVIAAAAPELAYLHRGSGGLAVRMPARRELLELLHQVGPLVAPSANFAGAPPATTVAEARAYFGDDIFYVDGGTLAGAASALVDVRGEVPKVLRPAPGFDGSKLV